MSTDIGGLAAALARAPGTGPVTNPLTGPATGGDAAAIAQTGEAFEAAFLAEMLRLSGFGELPEGLGGGGSSAGAREFTQFMVEAVARDIAATRPIGVGAAVAAALSERGGG